MIRKHWAAAPALALALLTGAAQAQQMTDPGDLAFWDSIKNSTNKAELRAYLQAYPNGRFAGLVRARLGEDTATPATAPTSTYTITITPTAARVGQKLMISCGNIPHGTSYDRLVVVPSGTPTDPIASKERELFSLYTELCAGGTISAGPFAPGAYELRWMSSLFNNDKPPRYEMKAKAAFTVQ